MTDETIQEQHAAIVDWRTTDWSRVARGVYRVRQHYRYTYSGPVTELKQRLVMIPPDRHADQRLLEHSLEVRGVAGVPRINWSEDGAANRIAQVLADRVDHAVDFEVRYRVERVSRRCRGGRGGRGARSGPLRGVRTLADYLRPTALTAPDARMREVAREIVAASATSEERAERAHDWAARAISYQHGVTGVQTPAAMALHLGKGVCQDYAHIMLTVLRLAEVPARYVSGHLLGEGAPHAWVEALVGHPDAPGGLRALAYDPTHHRRTGLNYITVAVGRDFADISPTSGFFSGGASGRLSASKQADILEVEYLDAPRRATGDGEDLEEDEAAA